MEIDQTKCNYYCIVLCALHMCSNRKVRKNQIKHEKDEGEEEEEEIRGGEE